MTGGPEATPARTGTFAPLAEPAYRRLWLAMIVSNLGTFLQMVAAPWLMLELTGSPFMVGLVTASLALPRLFMTVPAGALADALDRRTLLAVGQVGNAVSVSALGVLALQGRVTPEILVILSFLVGIGTAVSLPAFQSTIHDLVRRDLVPGAVALNSVAFNVARAVGPAIGGAMVAAGLVGEAFLLNGASYLVIIAVLLSLPRDVLSTAPREPVFRAVATGIRYVRYTPPLRLLLLVVAGFSLTAASVQTLLPNVTSDDLGLGANAYGILLGTFGGGALLSGLTQSWLRARIPSRIVLPTSIAVFGVTSAAFGLSRDPAVSGALLAVAGFTWVWAATTFNVTAQLLAPRWVRGRVISLYQLAFLGLMPIGSLLAGALAERAGAGNAVAVLSGGTFLLGLVARRLPLPVLDQIEEPHAPHDWTTQPHAARVSGSPVLVVTTFEVDPDQVQAFLAVATDLRRQRFRTGAVRWQLYRNADHPARITEIFQVHDWEDHMRQHDRIDEDVAGAIRRARTFDRRGGPVTRHLVGIDLFDPAGLPDFDELVAEHDELHAVDGSIPTGGTEAEDGPRDADLGTGREVRS